MGTMGELRTILSTRSLEDSLVKEIAGAGLGLIQSDFIRIDTLEDTSSIEYSTVIVSSKNALSGVDLKGKKIFCVGSKTKAAIEGLGYEVEKVFSSSEKLEMYVAALGEPATFICGRLRMDSVERCFKEASLQLQVIEAYETIMTPENVSEKYDAAIFFSPSGVESFFSKNEFSGMAVCIGPTTEAALKKYSNNSVVSDETTIESVVAKAIEIIRP